MDMFSKTVSSLSHLPSWFPESIVKKRFFFHKNKCELFHFAYIRETSEVSIIVEKEIATYKACTEIKDVGINFSKF
jgi:hypothetical protein